MSGTVPPPPPPPPGSRPESPSDGVARVERVSSADRLPPAIPPGRSGEIPAQEQTARIEPQPTVHEPIPPAPTSPAPTSPPPTWGAATEAWSPSQPSAQEHTAQLPPMPESARYQPASQEPASHQPAAHHAAHGEPTAYLPPVQQPATHGGGAAPGSEWWGQEWSGGGHQQAPSYAPGAYPPAGQGQYAAPEHQPGAQPYGGDQYGTQQYGGEQYGGDQYGTQQYGGDQYATQPYGGPPYGAQPYGAAGAAAPQGAAPAKPRRLTPGWIAFISVDVVLIALAIFFAVQIFGGGDPGSDEADPGPGTKASAEASSPAQEGEAAGEPLARFAAPSRNITCSIGEDAVTCGIAELDQQPAPVDGCDGTTGYVVTMTAADGEVSLPCVPASDQPKAAGKKVEVLEYGESRTEGDFTCTSSETGMKCQHDPTGRGFSLARAGIGTF